MATINLGAIKFNWKGAYAGGTAYAVDDVVSSGGSSYVCILASTGNAVSNGTYWELMSSAGTNGTDGTDLSTTITTQGDILYRDGSGLARLGYGTSGNVLTTKGSGQNPVWEAASGGTNTPSFFAVSTSTEDNNNVSDNSLTKMTFSTEVYDTDSNYASNRFTPTTAGKYFIFAKAMSDNVITNAQSKLEFYKNGSGMDENYRMRFKTGGTVGDIEHTMILSAIIDMNGSSDYIEVYAAHDNGGNTGGLYDKHFGAYKIII